MRLLRSGELLRSNKKPELHLVLVVCSFALTPPHRASDTELERQARFPKLTSLWARLPRARTHGSSGLQEVRRQWGRRDAARRRDEVTEA